MPNGGGQVKQAVGKLTAAAEAAPERLTVPALMFLTCLAAQLYLLFFKSFNWDEFLHFSFLYQINSGAINPPLQGLHLRAIWWAPEVAANLLDQMLAARIAMWAMHLVTLVMIYGVARQFTNVPNAFFAAFAYLTAGYVFTQAFSIRSDPFAAGTLMCALFLLARGPLTLFKAVVIGGLIGLAGLMTVKAVFYAPCFAGLAWLKGREAPGKLHYLRNLAIVAAAAFLTFGALYLHYDSTGRKSAADCTWRRRG